MDAKDYARAVPWWDTYEKDDLARWLDGNGGFTTATDAIDFYESPWQWGREYADWQAELRNEGLEEAA